MGPPTPSVDSSVATAARERRPRAVARRKRSGGSNVSAAARACLESPPRSRPLSARAPEERVRRLHRAMAAFWWLPSRWRPRRRLEWLRCRRLRRQTVPPPPRAVVDSSSARSPPAAQVLLPAHPQIDARTRAARPPAAEPRIPRRVLRRRRAPPRVPRLVLVRRPPSETRTLSLPVQESSAAPVLTRRSPPVVASNRPPRPRVPRRVLRACAAVRTHSSPPWPVAVAQRLSHHRRLVSVPPLPPPRRSPVVVSSTRRRRRGVPTSLDPPLAVSLASIPSPRSRARCR